MTTKEVLVFLAVLITLSVTSVYVRESFGILEGYTWTFVIGGVLGLISGGIARSVK